MASKQRQVDPDEPDSVGAATLQLVLVLVLAVVLTLVEIAFLTLHIGSVPAPLSILAAAVVTPILARWAYRVRGSLAQASLPAVVWLLISLIAALPGPGGDVVLPGDWRSVLYLLAGLVGCVVGTAWAIRPPDSTAAGADRAEYGGSSQRAPHPETRE